LTNAYIDAHWQHAGGNMKETSAHTNAASGGEPKEAVGATGGRAKPHSLAPVAGDVDVGEVISPKRSGDLLPWIMSISAVAVVAAVVVVYETRNPRLFSTDVASSTVASNDDDVFEHAGYGALRWRSNSPVVASDFATGPNWEDERVSLGPDLALLAESLGEAERQAASCATPESVGAVTLSVTFHPAGYVTTVEVDEQEQLGAEATECIMYAVLRSPTPTYVGEEMTIQHMFRLR
jgi:hypothetical protein